MEKVVKMSLLPFLFGYLDLSKIKNKILIMKNSN